MKQYNSWQGYKRLLTFIKPYKTRLVFAVICMALSGASNVVVPWLIKDVIDKVLANKDIYTLNLIVVGILILFLLRGFFYFGERYLMSFVGQKIVNDIREKLYRHLQTLSLSYYDKHKTGNIMSNLTNDVTALQTAIAGNLISFVQEAVILVGSLVSMIFLYWKLTLLTLVIVPLVVFTINFFGSRLRRAGHDVQGKMADITSLLEEAISGIRIIRSFNREDFEIRRFILQNDRNFWALMNTTRLTSLLTPFIQFFAAIAVTGIIWYGGMSVIILVIVLTGWAWGSRVLRSQTQALRSRDFVTAATFSGDSSARVIFHEIFPNMLSLIINNFFGAATAAALAEAGLEFLGLGDSTTVSWGTMIYWAQNNNVLLTGQWALLLAPGLMIALLAVSMTFINFGVDRLSNPRLREGSK